MVLFETQITFRQRDPLTPVSLDVSLLKQLSDYLSESESLWPLLSGFRVLITGSPYSKQVNS